MPMLPPYQLIRSRRRTLSLSVGKDLSIRLRAPLRMPLPAVEAFLGKHLDWVAKQQAQQERHVEVILTATQEGELRAAAKAILPKRVGELSALMGVAPTGVKITSAHTRWGSCSAKNSLCFSYRVMLLPPQLLDYLVVHELAHIRVKNHSAAFYREVERWLPDYRDRVSALKKLEKELPQ